MPSLSIAHPVLNVTPVEADALNTSSAVIAEVPRRHKIKNENALEIFGVDRNPAPLNLGRNP